MGLLPLEKVSWDVATEAILSKLDAWCCPRRGKLRLFIIFSPRRRRDRQERLAKNALGVLGDLAVDFCSEWQRRGKLRLTITSSKLPAPGPNCATTVRTVRGRLRA